MIPINWEMIVPLTYSMQKKHIVANSKSNQNCKAFILQLKINKF